MGKKKVVKTDYLNSQNTQKKAVISQFKQPGNST